MVSWSNSADLTLRKCPRRFWFQQVHASHRSAWGSPRHEAYVLANITTLEQWRGNLIHSVICDYVVPELQNNRVPNYEEVYAFTFNRLNKQLEFSGNRRYREEGITKKSAGDSYAALWEHEFEQSSDYTIDNAEADIEIAIRNLLSLTDLLNEIKSSNWLAPEANVQTKENGVTVEGTIDLVAATNLSRRKLIIVDWKLDHNQSHDYAPQLWLYAYLFQYADFYFDKSYKSQPLPHWTKSLPKKLIEVNLIHGDIAEYEWDEEQLWQVEDRVFRGTRRIKALLDGRKPSEIRGDEISVTENPRNCDFCPFRQPCQQFSAISS